MNPYSHATCYRSIDGNNGKCTAVGVANHVYIHTTGITSCSSFGASKGVKSNDEHANRLLRQSGQAVEPFFSCFRKNSLPKILD